MPPIPFCFYGRHDFWTCVTQGGWMLRLKNTLSRTQEEFKPLEGNTVRMYVCGPTVYDYGDIGNFRTFVAIDILRRYLKYLGYEVFHVMNITDVDDKIIRNVLKSGKSLDE